MVSGFLIGGAARLALPGPDPMPFSFTVAIGLAGAAAGVGIATAIYGGSHTFDTSSRAFVTLILEVGFATGLLAAYRRFVQKRPLWGPEAHRFPERGVGIKRMRARLKQLGIDPDKLTQRARRGSSPRSQPDPQDALDQLEKLREQRDQGKISDEDYEQARERLRRY